MIKIRDTIKMYGTILLAFGAVAVSTIFLNYSLDLAKLAVPDSSELAIIYEGQLTMSKIVTICAGGILGLVALIVLLFSIFHFLNRNQANMGILKAMGYSERAIAVRFAKYGIPVFLGTILGYVFGMSLASTVYSSMSEFEAISPAVTFHFVIPVLFVLLPTILFSCLSCVGAYLKLQKEPLDMIKNTAKVKISKRAAVRQEKIKDCTFLVGLKKTMRSHHPLLLLFVGIAAWGFSAMIQMAFTMMSIEMSDIAPAISAPIGIMMGFVTLIIAANFIITANRPYIALMKAYGYTDTECHRALLSGYRPAAWIGFAMGTPYQYFLMKLIVSLFAGAYDVEVTFSVVGFFVTLIGFLIYYEAVMFFYRKKIEKISLSQSMID